MPAPRGVDPASNQPFFDQGTGEFPLPQAGQPAEVERDREETSKANFT